MKSGKEGRRASREGGLTRPVRFDALKFELLRQGNHCLVAAAATAVAAHCARIVWFDVDQMLFGK